MRWAVGWVLVAAVATPAAMAAADRAPTVDGKLCPRPSQLRRIASLRDAVQPAKRFAHLTGRRGVIRQLERGDQSGYAPAARRICGAAVVTLSVYVKVHPRGQACSACDLRALVVHYRTGRFRVWEAY
jgi:hypothetical protein